jgi:glycosyltransferase involved in cell wall biosynthesis
MNDTALRVGLDGEALRLPLSGVGRYVHHLAVELERLWPQARFFAYARLGADALALPSPRWTLRREPVPALRRLPSFLWLKTRGAALARADALDVFWAARTLHPRLPGVHTVSTVHDLNHRLVPETMQRATRWSHALWLDADVRCAQAVVANSRGTAERLRATLGVEAQAVVRPGVDAGLAAAAHGVSPVQREALGALGVVPPYLLAVGTLEPRKNVGALLDAFLALRADGLLAGHRLVLVGARGWQNRALAARLEAARGQGVVLPGYVSDDLLPAVYAGADALVCPSLYEGFGMPVLEARACGTPVVVADVPELREAGGLHAVVVAPDAAGVAAGIRRTLDAPRVHEDGVARVHSWRLAGVRMAHVLRPPPPGRLVRETLA